MSVLRDLRISQKFRYAFGAVCLLCALMGTASLIRKSDLQGSAAGLAMAMNGILTSLLMIPVYPWFRGWR